MSVQAKISLDMNQLASIIKSLSDEDVEELEMLLSGETKELKKRVSEIKSKKVKLLSREEVFGDL